MGRKRHLTQFGLAADLSADCKFVSRAANGCDALIRSFVASAANAGSEPSVTNAAARINGGFRKYSGRLLIVDNANL
jgi:hypothetical protein